jgi:hypothetical protein
MSNDNGFKIRGWSDVVSILVILGALAAAITWGIRLDQRSIDQEARISRLEAR